MPTLNVPFIYATKSNNTIHLYFLIYSGSTPPSYSDMVQGNVKSFNVQIQENGSPTKHFKKYSFNAGSLTDININFTVGSTTKLKKIIISGLGEDEPPVAPEQQAFDAPYSFIKKVSDDQFKLELVVFSQQAKNYDCVHSPNPTGNDGNTWSEINMTNTSSTKEFEHSRTFDVVDFEGEEKREHEHQLYLAGNPPKRRTKTKNKNVTIVPFPRSRQ